MSHAVRHRGPSLIRLLVGLGVLALLGAACGDDDDTDVAAPDSTETTETTATTATTTAPAGDDYGTTGDTTADAGGGPTVELAESDLGSILVADGRTLYAFTPDTDGTSTCYDDCATTWPPLVAAGKPAVGEGLDAALFTTSPRTDGEEQVVVDGQPLYFFANDAAPGDTNGQGIGDVWYVVGADGALIQG